MLGNFCRGVLRLGHVVMSNDSVCLLNSILYNDYFAFRLGCPLGSLPFAFWFSPFAFYFMLCPQPPSPNNPNNRRGGSQALFSLI